MDAARIALDLFIADGGVDDFEDLTEAEIRSIVHRELVNHMVELVVARALELQNDPDWR
jgi:hypothetical protein